jgi:NADH dehydrogenase FAD-containing subunit
VRVRTSVGVSEVRAKAIVLSDGEVLPYGVAVWAAGKRRRRGMEQGVRGRCASAGADVGLSIRG